MRGCKQSIRTLGIFIGPQEVGQKIGQTNTQTNKQNYANFDIDQGFLREFVKNGTILPILNFYQFPAQIELQFYILRNGNSTAIFFQKVPATFLGGIQQLRRQIFGLF